MRGWGRGCDQRLARSRFNATPALYGLRLKPATQSFAQGRKAVVDIHRNRANFRTAANRRRQLVIDGEAVVLGVDGVADFDALHTRKHDAEVQFYAFDILFRAACDMGLEGLVSKRRDRPYQGGRSKHWIKGQESKASRVRASEGRVRIGPRSLQRRSWRGYRVPDLTFAIAVNLNSGVSLRAYRSTLASS